MPLLHRGDNHMDTLVLPRFKFAASDDGASTTNRPSVPTAGILALRQRQAALELLQRLATAERTKFNFD